MEEEMISIHDIINAACGNGNFVKRLAAECIAKVIDQLCETDDDVQRLIVEVQFWKSIQKKADNLDFLYEDLSPDEREMVYEVVDSYLR